jgi:acetyl-CoA synthetase
MSEKLYPVPPAWKDARVDAAAYRALYARSAQDPGGFWGEQALRLDWIAPFTKVKHTSFDTHNVEIRWFEDGTTNVAMNCVDRKSVV